MRTSRFVPAVVALVVGAMVAATVAPAGAATPGVGATTGDLSVVDLDVGELIDLGVLSDLGAANTDPDVGDTKAAAALSALEVVSQALGVDEKLEVMSVESSGEEQSASQGVQPVDNPVLAGSILPADLSAAVGSDGAVSTIGAGIADLDVLTGILSLTSTQLGLGANSLTEQADASRALKIDGLTALDLGSLLAGLGIPLTDLPVDTVLGLIDGLGLLAPLGQALEGLGLDLDLENLDLASVTELIDGLIGLIGVDLGSDLTEPLCNAAGGLLGALGVPDTCDSDLPGVASGILDVLDGLGLTDVDGLLQSVLDTLLGLLDGTALLAIDGLDVGADTLATESLETSVANVTAALGDISVGGLTIPGVDLLDTAEQITGVVDQINNQLASILDTIDPGLAGLIDIGLLEESTSLTETDRTVDAVAEFTGIRVEVNPVLSVIEGILAGLGGVESIGDILSGLGTELPVNPLTELNRLVGGAGDPVSILADGVSLTVASISQQSSFTEVLSSTATPETPATPSTPDLPRTGSNDTVLILMAAVAAVGALGIRQVVRAKR